jgi:hypothetical protein
MNAIDHSVLIFLLDAIESRPDKAIDLLALAARRPQASETFKAEVRQLTEIQRLTGSQTAATHR